MYEAFTQSEGCIAEYEKAISINKGSKNRLNIWLDDENNQLTIYKILQDKNSTSAITAKVRRLDGIFKVRFKCSTI